RRLIPGARPYKKGGSCEPPFLFWSQPLLLFDLRSQQLARLCAIGWTEHFGHHLRLGLRIDRLGVAEGPEAINAVIGADARGTDTARSEEHTSELQSRENLV